jgi:hypothetical protein
MGINSQKARNNSKSSVLFIIKDIRILHNYLVPFFDKVEFLSKKDLDFKDFKIISRIVYYGAHKEEPTKSLILKLSRIIDQRNAGKTMLRLKKIAPSRPARDAPRNKITILK